MSWKRFDEDPEEPKVERHQTLAGGRLHVASLGNFTNPARTPIPRCDVNRAEADISVFIISSLGLQLEWDRRMNQYGSR